MLARLHEFLHTPFFDVEEETRLVRLLNANLWFGIIFSSLGVILSTIFAPPAPRLSQATLGSLFLLYLVSLFLLRRGHSHLSAIIFIFGMGCLLTVSALFFEGVPELSFGGYIIVILIASLVLGWRSGVITFILSALSTAFVLFLQIYGWLPTFTQAPAPAIIWISKTIIFAWVLFLVYISSRNLQEALHLAHENEQALAKSYTEQQATRISLEAYTRDLERRVVQLQVAADVARDAASVQEVNMLLDRVVNLVRNRFGFYHAAIFMIDEHREFAILRSATGEAGQKLIDAEYKLKVGEVGIVGYVTGTGQPRIVLDVDSDSTYFQNPFLPDTRSELALPLKAGEAIIGALDVQSKQPDAFDEDDVSILQTLADQVAIAIANARLFEATRRQVEELTALHAIAMAGAEATSENELIERVTHLIAEAFYPDNFGVLLIDESAGVLRHHSSYQERQKVIYEPIPLGSGIVGRAAQEGQAYRVRDVSQEPSYLAVDTQTRSELCVPIKIGERVIGVINAESTKIDDFSENDERLLSTFASQLATAIQKVRLFEAARRRVAELEALRQASLNLNSSLDLQRLLEVILDQAIHLVAADTAHLFLYNGEVLTFGAAYWAEGYPKELHPNPRPHGLTYRVARSGQRMVVSDVLNHPVFADTSWNGAVVGLPIRRGSQVLGVMNLAFHGGPRQFDENELRVLELLADQAAIAMINANLYSEAQERARQLAEALKQREELDRLKDEFIQNVSHELRTPLAVTRGYVELLETGEIGELNKEQQDAISILSRRVNMLIKLVDDLVVILETEARDMVREEINLNDLILRTIDDFKTSADQADLSLSASVPSQSIIFMGNFNHLSRLMDNLINNAIKFTPPEGLIQVHLRQEMTNVIIEVIDTGIGISPDKISRIFERFYQVDGSTKRRFGGIGLGLSLVKGIAEAHGGTVAVKSELGHGSTFTVTLPL
jgi:signal transduction histidine kinase